mmetsp:Transcript_51865/g.116251  ORF Transcript_51865/g.116251 Transcript_51865/m.116251 type:complete len:587 (+) Transcript_51865:48-1808(+)
MPAVQADEAAIAQGAEEEHEEGLLTGPAGAFEGEEESKPLQAPEVTPVDAQARRAGGFEDDCPDLRGRDLETLSELSEAPTDNTSQCAVPTGSGRGSLNSSFLPPSAMALFYPLLRLPNRGGRQTRCEATLNLLNNLLGAGLLAMPRAMADAGLFSGLAVMGIVAVANRYTLLQVMWMSHSVLSSEKCSYPELGRHVFGQKGLIAVLVAYLLFTGGILTAYLVVIVDLLRQLTSLAAAPRFVLVGVAVLVCLPGASLRSLRHVALVSGVCMVGVCCLVVILTSVCVSDVLSPDLVNAPVEEASRPGDVDLFRGDLRRLLSGAALFSLQFSVQAGGIEVLGHLAAEEEQDEANMTSLLAAEDISQLAFFIALVFSSVMGSAAYIRFGDHVAGNVLLDFSPSAPYLPLMLSWISYGFVVICSFAFIIVPCRMAAVDIFALRRRNSGDNHDAVTKEKFHYLNALILGFCSLVAWMVSDLSRVLTFVGVWATMALAFVLPGAFLIELRRRQEGLPLLSTSNAVPLLLIAFGLVVVCSSTVEFVTSAWGAEPERPIGARGHRAFVTNMADTVGSSFPQSHRRYVPAEVHGM